ncbi:hypothetical protein [Actinoplanes sp. NPDC049316]|uniref:hypothetical protein n=1 Tax=Actinoplanes sp. NPDC049316 TaxID=3154727 RepID=UPI00342FB56D
MTASLCGAEAILRAGGPVQVPLHPCCIVTLLRASRLPEARPGGVTCPLRALSAAVTVAREVAA